MGATFSSGFDEVDSDIRYLVIQTQMVFYIATADAVEIIRVLDGRSDYLARLFL